MRKKKLLILMGSVCLVFVLVALPFMTACPAPVPTAPVPEKTSTPVPTAEKVYTAKFACTVPSIGMWGEHCRIFKRHVEEATNGRLILECYYVGELFKSGLDANKAVMTGAMDMSFYNNTEIIPVLAKWGAISIAGFNLGAEHIRCLEETDAWKALNKEMEEKSGVKNVVVCSVLPQSYVWTTSKPVRCMEDMKGLKIREMETRSRMLTMEALGASVIALDIAEALPSLATGMVDGVVTNIPCIPSMFKGAELLKYSTVGYGGVGLGAVILGFTVNLDFWNSLPADIRAAVEAEMPAVEEETQAYLDAQCDAAWEEWLASPGTEKIVLDAEETKRWLAAIDEAVEPLYGELGVLDLVAASDECAVKLGLK